jgi:hypothetical protein
VIDAKRGEIFALVDGAARCVAPDELPVEPGTGCVGDGAVRYRAVLEAAGAEVPPDDDEAHAPRARYHALLAAEFGPADRVLPVYLRIPDAEKAVAR